MSQDKYFNVKIQNKNYPSCYQYNVLIMLAKRLIKEENEKIEEQKTPLKSNHRFLLDKKLIERVI